MLNFSTQNCGQYLHSKQLCPCVQNISTLSSQQRIRIQSSCSQDVTPPSRPTSASRPRAPPPRGRRTPPPAPNPNQNQQTRNRSQQNQSNGSNDSRRPYNNNGAGSSSSAPSNQGNRRNQSQQRAPRTPGAAQSSGGGQQQQYRQPRGDRQGGDGGRPQRDGGRSQRDGARPQRDGGRSQRDGGRPQRDGGRQQADRNRGQRDGDRKGGNQMLMRQQVTNTNRGNAINRGGSNQQQRQQPQNQQRKPNKPRPPKRKHKGRMTRSLTTSTSADTLKDIREKAAQRRAERKQRAAASAGGAREMEDLFEVPAAGMTVDEVAEKLAVDVPDVIKALFMKGIMVTSIQRMDPDTVKVAAKEFGAEVMDADAIDVTDEAKKDVEFISEDDLDKLVRRPPVVTVMGHVDHGKTTLLDTIRQRGLEQKGGSFKSVAAGEAGGITQAIGAYNSSVSVENEQRTMCFIDTPGHEAFGEMRARGTRVTDVAIIVCAVDDGVQPQTKEAVLHAQRAGVPIVVALNKMDRPGSDPLQTMTQLADLDLQPVDWGGSTPMVPISALTGMGIEQLLQEVVLLTDVELTLEANPEASAKGTVIEASLNRRKGPVATVVVQNGTLRKGDIVVAGAAYGRVKQVWDDLNQAMDEAGPSTACQILGLSTAPDAGEVFKVYSSLHEAQDKALAAAEQLREKRRLDSLELATVRSLATIDEDQEALKVFNIVLKADCTGSIEAIKNALKSLPQQSIMVRFLVAAPGDISNSDIEVAKNAQAMVIGFNVKEDGIAMLEAKQLGVKMKVYSIIYDIINDVRAGMEAQLKSVAVREKCGTAKVQKTFDAIVGTVAAGCTVSEGFMAIGDNYDIEVYRDEKLIHKGPLSQLRRFKDKVKKVEAGKDCGLIILKYRNFKVGDYVHCFETKSVRRTLEEAEATKAVEVPDFG